MRTSGRSVYAVALRFVLLALCDMCLGCSSSESVTAQSAMAQQSGPLVLRGGRLIDGTGRASVEASVVLVEGEKIVRVGADGEVAIPPGATIINLTGKTIIPGLVDGHGHLNNAKFLPMWLYWGVTTASDYKSIASWAVVIKSAVEKGHLVGPHLLLNYPIDSLHPVAARRRPPGWASERWAVGSGAAMRRVGMDTYDYGHYERRLSSDEASMEAAILQAKEWGFDAVQFYQSVPTALLKTGTEIAHRHGLPVFGQFASPSVPRATSEILDTGMDLHIEMLPVVLATISKADLEKAHKEGLEAPEDLAYLMNPSLFPALAQKMIDRKMILGSHLEHDFPEISKHREEFERLNTAFLKGPFGSLLPGAFLGAYKPYGKEKNLEQMKVGWQKILQFVKLYVDKGGIVIPGSGANLSKGAPGLSLHNDMVMLTEAGLTPMQAIQAATLWSMRAWRKDREAGSVEAGKRADLVVLNRNPLDDISAIRDIHMVIKSGQVVDREALSKWKNPFPQPDDQNERRIPLVDEVSPFGLPVSKNGAKVAEVIIKGGNFTPECRVVFNDQFVPTKFYDSNRLGITIAPSQLKEPGTYPLSVIQPGSGGGVSNLWYFYVTF